MTPTSLNELILSTGGGSYALDAACTSTFDSPQLETLPQQRQPKRSLPFEHIIVDEVELNLPVHLYANKELASLNAAQLMVMMPSTFLGSSARNISSLKIIFKIRQDV